MAIDDRILLAYGTLSSGIDASQTTIPLDDASSFTDPTNGYNGIVYDLALGPHLDPDAEAVRISSAKTGNTLNVTRAQEGTTGVAHNTGGKNYAIIAGPTTKIFNDIADVVDFFAKASATRLAAVSGKTYSFEAAEFSWGSAASKTIASAAITADRTFHVLVPELGTSDTLSTINGSSESGQLLVLRASSAGAYDITLDQAGNITLQRGGKVVLNSNAQNNITLYSVNAGADWLELTRSGTAHPSHGPSNTEQIVGGVITTDSGVIQLTPQTGTTDDLDTINIANGGVIGDTLILHGSSGNTITAKDGTGNLRLNGDFAMSGPDDTMMLVYMASSVWAELTRSNNDGV